MAWFRACTHVCASMCWQMRVCVCSCAEDLWGTYWCVYGVLLLFVRQRVSPSAKWMWMLMSWVIFSSLLKGRHSANWAAWLLQQSATSQMEVDPGDVMAGMRERESIEWRKSAQWPPLNTGQYSQAHLSSDKSDNWQKCWTWWWLLPYMCGVVLQMDRTSVWCILLIDQCLY